MGHHLSAVILKGSYNSQTADAYHLQREQLPFDLTLFYLDHHESEEWQEKLGTKGYLEINCKGTLVPHEMAVYELMGRVSERPVIQYAVILTDYFAGMGNQYANVYENWTNINPKINSISQALNYLGVQKGEHYDEFDAVGLSNFRANPDEDWE